MVSGALPPDRELPAAPGARGDLLAVALRNGVQRLHGRQRPAEDLVDPGHCIDPGTALVGAHHLSHLSRLRDLSVVDHSGAWKRAPGAATGLAVLPPLRSDQHGHARPVAVHLVLVPVRDRFDAAAAWPQGPYLVKRTLGLLIVLLLAPATAWAVSAGYVGGQYRYWAFSDHNDLRDVLAYWVPGPLHVQVEIWDFVNPETEDQFRPEVGIHLRDSRRSVYTFQWRSEGHQERFW